MASTLQPSDASITIIHSSGRHGQGAIGPAARFPSQFQPIGVVDQPIQDGVPERRIWAALLPLVSNKWTVSSLNSRVYLLLVSFIIIPPSVVLYTILAHDRIHFFGGRSPHRSSTSWRKPMTAPRLDLVPELDKPLIIFPTQINFSAIFKRRKIDQP